MRRVWLIGGTSDARALADRLVDEGFSLLATVATVEGEAFWPERYGLEVRAGRLDRAAMDGLLAGEDFLAVVDGSHPYAAIVTVQARDACAAAGVAFFRLGRPRSDLPAGVHLVPTAQAAADFLAGQEGRIFLTLGSKELESFAALEGARERLTVRVLPAVASLEKCAALGLGPAHVIAMTGPFSQATNELQMREAGVRWLVTKDGGTAGGVPEKLAAAVALGIGVVVVTRPEESAPSLSADGISDRLRELAGGEAGVDEPRNAASTPFFPLYTALRAPVLVVGGGPVAIRRAAALTESGVSVRLVSPTLCDAARVLEGRPGFEWRARPWRDDDCDGVSLVLAATDDDEINGTIGRSARRRAVPFNRADRHEDNDVLFPAVVRCGVDLAALSTGGTSPARTAALAARLRQAWPDWCAEVPLGRPLRIASRESDLAMAQSRIVADRLEALTGCRPEIVPLTTRGDAVKDRILEKVGGKGLFTCELEEALRLGRADLAVHSLKDMPAQNPEGLTFAAFLDRSAPQDCLVLRSGLTGTPERIGTSSRRRTLQAELLFPGARFLPLRGNLRTRLTKLDRGEYDGLILAVAGLRRLGLEGRIARIFAPDEMVPSAGQGTLVIQCLDRGPVRALVARLDERDVRLRSLAERAFIDELDGGCSAPHAAFARLSGTHMSVLGLYVAPDDRLRRGELDGPADDGEALARRLARRLRDEGEMES